MFFNNSDLEIMIGNANRFESLIHDLILSESILCGIPLDKINWDYRTNVGDGGRDIEINVASTNESRSFMPLTKSYWSIKSGKDGLEPSTLENEVCKHPKVLDYLKSNSSYVWCVAVPVNNNYRDKLRDKADMLSQKYEFNKDLIHFMYNDTITAWINKYPGIIPKYFPSLPLRWKTINEWIKDNKFFKVPWVDISNRSTLITRIIDHFYGTFSPNILHLVGQSGIGKSRTVNEACKKEKLLESVLYFENIDCFTSGYERYITRDESIHSLVIIDDVTIEEWNKLYNRLSEYNKRIRIVTIGPLPKGRGDFYDENILLVTPPDDNDDITKVIQSYDSSISKEQSEEIAKWSDCDLRLALLLSESYKRDPGLRNKPIQNVQEIFNRILKLYKNDIGDINEFRKFYEIFSMLVDLGYKNKYRKELTYISNYFGKPETDFDRAINLAISCGLGNSKGDFFEATPRALARFVFENWTWDIIKHSVTKFIKGMPTYQMQKRFFERGQECNSKLREEVNSALAEWFREEFAEYDISLIFTREASRVFLTYTELDPENGLAWLRKSVEIAPAQILLSFDGKTDGSGGWRGRRQAVWLCEHLACFPEYFYTCESILFRLALFETENDIGNNSTVIWQGLFLPVMSWTAIPFEDRLNILLKRLSNANMDELYLVANACVKLLQDRISRMIPPKVIGGRLTPEEWRPKTYKELYDLRKDAASRIIYAVKGLRPEKQDIPTRLIIENIQVFLKNDCFDLLCGWFTLQALNEEQSRLLRKKLDEYISFLELNNDKDKNNGIHKELNDIKKWRNSLEPITLESEIKEVTSRGYWSLRNVLGDNDRSKTYQLLAENTLNNIHVLDNLWDWFKSKDAISSRFFGMKLGYLDKKHILYPIFMPKLLSELITDLIDGYIYGILEREGCIPEFITNDLDKLAPTYPKQLIIITINSDCSEHGFKRLLMGIPLAGENVSQLLFGLASNPWSSFLSDNQKNEVLRLLISLAENNDQYAYKTALELLALWNHDKKENLIEPLASAALYILKHCIDKNCIFDDHYWNKVASMLPDTFLIEKIDILTIALVNWELGLHLLQDDALESLIEVAKVRPNEVMQSLGLKINDVKYKDIFFISVFRRLFEAIGLDVVKRWIQSNGIEAGRAIARHIQSPEPTETIPDYIPPLTEWLLTEFENDDRFFREFCAGRHSFESFSGPASDRFKEIYKNVSPYLNHKLRRIREWAEYEIDRAKENMEWDKKHDAEFDRG
ncbi:hypothetical protein DFR58_103251 [Anaerobacterium chartisolvens]|uniref:Uncharacterized protein n=1 Tax=Anaerobacterium chartisolvens TaxID=1297424 RepID=A0A369BIH3_9FIRM|nr:ATP-binding protein [Anaerobacterium chartisolvens]RCX19504.1 hypothetical protein DFR58_103251 [Anaerobacterium chartisolvens]